MKSLKGYWGNMFKEDGVAKPGVNHEIFNDIEDALYRLEEARLYFESALGKDQVDYAIYMLEAAEIKYQIHLRKAKDAGIDRREISNASSIISRVINRSV
ncbi:hypothetical protein [Paenibacillus sp. CMAA1364]